MAHRLLARGSSATAGAIRDHACSPNVEASGNVSRPLLRATSNFAAWRVRPSCVVGSVVPAQPNGAPFHLRQRHHRVVLRVACRCAPGEADSQSPRRGVLRTVAPTSKASDWRTKRSPTASRSAKTKGRRSNSMSRSPPSHQHRLPPMSDVLVRLKLWSYVEASQTPRHP